MSADVKQCGDAEHCCKCGIGPASRWRNSIWYYCEFHAMIWDIVGAATRSDVLILKNGEYYDYKSDVLAKYIEEKVKGLRRR